MTQKKINFAWAPIAIVFAILAIGFMAHDAMESPKTVIPEGYVSGTDLQNAVSNEVANAVELKDSQIADLTNQLTEKAKIVELEVKESLGYLIDKIFFGEEVTEELSDREIALVDSKVRFDGEDYDVEEVVKLSNMNVQTNLEDFDGNAYLVIPSDSVEYNVVFESGLNTGLITDEETLSFFFLGNEVTVSKWVGDEITFSQGTETMLNMGEKMDVDGKVLTLVYVMGDSDKESVYIDVDGTSKEIDEGETKVINGIEVEVKNVIYSTVGPTTKAVLVVGKEVKVEVKSGDEYEDDSIWEYFVDSNTLGLVLKEEFRDLDDEYMPLNAGEKLCLPNDYVCVRYDGVLDEDFEDITFELDTKDLVDYVEVNGNFQSGLNDFDRLYVDRSDGKFYDEDLVLIDGTITVGDSDVTISCDGTDITVGDFNVKLDLLSSSAGDDDVDYRTEFGILVKDPDNAIDDENWDISVPLEQLESSLTIL